PSFTQRPDNGKEGKSPPPTSYDQVSPALLGQETFAKMQARDKAGKAEVMARQKKLLAIRYDLSVRVDPKVKMSGGRKAIPVGPATLLPKGMKWSALAKMSPEQIKAKGLFPKGFLPLPHPHHEVGGMVFTQAQIKQLPRLERFDLDF